MTSHANTSAPVANGLNVGQITLPLSDHNVALPGDVLTTISINHEWRRFIVHKVEDMLVRSTWDGTEAEIDTAIEQVHALISDFYTAEVSVMEYHGALLTTQTSMTLTTAIQVIRDFAVAGEDSHDTDGFFDAGFDTGFFTIPVGLGGFYLVRGVYNVAGGPNTVWFTIGKGVLERVVGLSGHVGLHIINVQSIMLLNDGDNVSVLGQVGTATRIMQQNVVWGRAAQFSLYRLGDAP